MDRFRSRSSHDGQGPRTRPWWVFAAPGTRTRRPGFAGPTGPRLATRMLLLVALAASSLALTQCRMVGDQLTGVRVDSFKRKSDCVKECKDTYKNARKDENALHASNVSACRSDPACQATEANRHDGVLLQIEAAYAACLYECHLQGGGTVGP